MTDTACAPASEPLVVPVREILPWLLFAGLLAFVSFYFVGLEQGASALLPGQWIHEFLHDGRHVLGYPCH